MDKLSKARRSAPAAKVGLTNKRLVTLGRKFTTGISSVEKSNVAEITDMKKVNKKVRKRLMTAGAATSRKGKRSEDFSVRYECGCVD